MNAFKWIGLTLLVALIIFLIKGALSDKEAQSKSTDSSLRKKMEDYVLETTGNIFDSTGNTGIGGGVTRRNNG